MNYRINFIFFIVVCVALVFSFNITEVKAQGNLLSISMGTDTTMGSLIPKVNDDVLYLDFTASGGSSVINSLTFTEATYAATATDYQLFVFNGSDYDLLASGGNPVNGAVVFSGLNYTVSDVSTFKVEVNTQNTISAYRLDLTNISLTQGELITSLPFEGALRYYSGDLTQHELLPDLTILDGGSVGGIREQSSFQELMRVNFTADSAPLTITSLTFEEVYFDVNATNYRLYVDDTLIFSDLETYDEKIILTDLNIVVVPGLTKRLKVVGDTTNTYTNYQLKLSHVATKETCNIEDLPLWGGTITFSIHMEGNVNAWPQATIERSSSELLMGFQLRPVGSDVVLDNIRFTYDPNSGVTDFKLYSSADILLAEAEYDGPMVSFVDLSYSLLNNFGAGFMIKADTINAETGSFQLLSMIPSTTPLAETLTHGFPLSSNELAFFAPTTTTPSLTANLDSDTPGGSILPGINHNLLKFDLVAANGSANINKIKIKQIPADAQVINYRLTDMTENIVLAENVNPVNGYIEFLDFDNMNSGGTKNYRISADISNITDSIQLQIDSITTMEPITINNLPLLGKTITRRLEKIVDSVDLILEDPEPAEPLPLGVSAGSLVKREDMDVVYFVDNDNRRHGFPNEKVFYSWYEDFSEVKTITSEELAAIPLGANVTMRPGTCLVKIQSDPKVYAVEPYGVLRWIKTDTIAKSLYGLDWQTRIADVGSTFFINYQLGLPIDSAIHPTGSLFGYEGDDGVYYMEDGVKRYIPTTSFINNKFQNKFVYRNVSNSISYESGVNLPIIQIESLMTLR